MIRLTDLKKYCHILFEILSSYFPSDCRDLRYIHSEIREKYPWVTFLFRGYRAWLCRLIYIYSDMRKFT